MYKKCVFVGDSLVMEYGDNIVGVAKLYKETEKYLDYDVVVASKCPLRSAAIARSIKDMIGKSNKFSENPSTKRRKYFVEEIDSDVLPISANVCFQKTEQIECSVKNTKEEESTIEPNTMVFQNKDLLYRKIYDYYKTNIERRVDELVKRNKVTLWYEVWIDLTDFGLEEMYEELRRLTFDAAAEKIYNYLLDREKYYDSPQYIEDLNRMMLQD